MYNVLKETKILGAHRAVYFQLMFLYALKCEWTEAIKYAELVRKETTHSPTVTTYCEAVFLFVKSRQTNDQELKRKASELMKSVISLIIIKNINRLILSQNITNRLKLNKMKSFNLFHRIIPSLRIRHLGKTFTPEKIAVENSLKYFKNNEFLILPEMVS